MSKEDVRKALVAMDDDDQVRGHLANGDFTDIGNLDLEDHERQLVRAAAYDYPEVAGFTYDALMSGYDLKQGKAGITFSPAVQKIFDYCCTGKHFPKAQL